MASAEQQSALRQPGRILGIRPGIARSALDWTGYERCCESNGKRVLQQGAREIWYVEVLTHASPPGKPQQRAHERSRRSESRAGAGILAIRNGKRSAANSARDQSPGQRSRPEAAGEQRRFVADEFTQRQFAGRTSGACRIEKRQGRTAERQAAIAGRPTDGCGRHHGAEASYKSDTKSTERRRAISHANTVARFARGWIGRAALQRRRLRRLTEIGTPLLAPADCQ